jgi:type III pantothenate kinase
MLLAIDVGNSDITIGVSEHDEWNQVWRLPAVGELTALYYSHKIADGLFESRISRESIRLVVISSVVPGLTTKIVDACRSLFDKVIVVAPDIYSKLAVKVLNPYEIGSDLVCNAVAAYEIFHQRCIVVDFGTALTFTAISDEGEILGVAIAPGLKTAIKALSQNTARLFDVPLEVPESVLGKGTVHAMQAGILVGYEGMVRHMITRIKAELNSPDINVVATGGLSSIISPLKDVFTRIDTNLTLTGLRVIGELVSGLAKEGGEVTVGNKEIKK